MPPSVAEPSAEEAASPQRAGGEPDDPARDDRRHRVGDDRSRLDRGDGDADRGGDRDGLLTRRSALGDSAEPEPPSPRSPATPSAKPRWAATCLSTPVLPSPSGAVVRLLGRAPAAEAVPFAVTEEALVAEAHVAARDDRPLEDGAGGVGADGRPRATPTAAEPVLTRCPAAARRRGGLRRGKGEVAAERERAGAEQRRRRHGGEDDADGGDDGDAARRADAGGRVPEPRRGRGEGDVPRAGHADAVADLGGRLDVEDEQGERRADADGLAGRLPGQGRGGRRDGGLGLEGEVAAGERDARGERGRRDVVDEGDRDGPGDGDVTRGAGHRVGGDGRDAVARVDAGVQREAARTMARLAGHARLSTSETDRDADADRGGAAVGASRRRARRRRRPVVESVTVPGVVIETGPVKRLRGTEERAMPTAAAAETEPPEVSAAGCRPRASRRGPWLGDPSAWSRSAAICLSTPVFLSGVLASGSSSPPPAEAVPER